VSELREDPATRLRRILRATGSAPRPAIPAPAASGDEESERSPLPSWLRGALARRAAQPPVASVDPVDPVDHRERRAPARTLGPPRALTEESNERGELAARTSEFDADCRHGDVALREVDGARASTLELVSGDPRLAHFDARRAIYLDIETTGLSGGAGTHVFLVGLGRFEGERFAVWQGFLRHPGEAAALLEACAIRIREASALVSFFGKSFDRHRLEDQMRLARVDPPFAGLPHLDLYHPCRRLYARALPNARLATMERALCGLQREDDLSGSFAPAAYFDFLAEREHLLEHVFRHNLLDVLSLVTLCAHVGRVEDERRADLSSLGLSESALALPGPSGARAEALAKLHLRARRREEALPWLDRALERGGPRDDLRLLRAQTLRRLGRWDGALAELRSLEAQASGGLAPELAPVLERELARALRRIQRGAGQASR
jgi:uncharacterized protein